MQKAIVSIDRVYVWVIAFSMRCVDACVSVYDVPLQKEEGISSEYESEIELVSNDTAPLTTTFKTVREVLKGYQKNLVGALRHETLLESKSTTDSVGDTVSTPVSTTQSRVEVSTQKNTVMYAQSVRVFVYKNPTIEFDAHIGEIPYGEMVIVLEPRGRFYRIMWNTIEGWVLRDDIADRAVRVYPAFTIGEENSVDHPNTAQVRTILDDVFGIGCSEFPLQAGEYVLYRLWRKGIHLVWPETRPRIPGLWHKILKGSEQVHIGVTPKVGTVMEYMISPEIGHLALVDAVFPDDTIIISEANFPDSGIYNERVLTKEEWKDYKPLFLAISEPKQEKPV